MFGEVGGYRCAYVRITGMKTIGRQVSETGVRKRGSGQG